MFYRKFCQVALPISFFSSLVLAEISEYVEVKQIYRDKGILAVIANTTIKFANTVSVMINGDVCDLPIDSKNGNYLFLKAQPCVEIEKITPAQRIEVALLQSEKPIESQPTKSEKTEDNNELISSGLSNSGFLDYQIPKSNLLINANLINQNTSYTLKYMNTSVGSASSKSTKLNVGAELGVTDKTSIGIDVDFPINIKSNVDFNTLPDSETKTSDMSDPKISLQHRFAEGIHLERWTPFLNIGVGTKLRDAEVMNDEGTLRDGGFSVDFGIGATKRYEQSIVGVQFGYYAPFERTVNNVESGSTSKRTGGEAIMLRAGWQHLTTEASTFGVGISTAIFSSTDTTSTSSQGAESKYEVSNYTRTSLDVIASLAITPTTVLQFSYNIALPYDLSEKIGTVEIEESSDKDYLISVGLSQLLDF